MNKQEIIDKRLRAIEAFRSTVNEGEKNGKTDQNKLDQIEADIQKFDAELASIRKDENKAKLESFENNSNRPVDYRRVDVRNEFSNDQEKASFFQFLRTGNVSEYAYQIGASAGSDYQVPQPIATSIVERLQRESIVRQECARYGNVRTYNGDLKMGIGGQTTAYMIDEGQAYTASSAMNQETLSAYKFGALVVVTDEALYDTAQNLEQFIVNEAGRALGELEENKFLNGTGTTEPDGLLTLTSFAGVSISSGSTATSSVVTHQDLVDTFYGMRTAYRRNSSWVLNSSTVAKVRGMKDDNGYPIWVPATNGENDLLFGRPVLISDFAPTYAASTIVGGLVDFSNIVIGDRMRVEVKKLNETYALNGKVGWRFTHRSDIKPMSPYAVHLLKIGS